MKYATGDSHFNHQLMTKMRGFTSPAGMNEFIIQQWNQVIKVGDLVYHLGDFALPNNGDGHDIDWIIDQLNGQIILIEGNHDLNVKKWFDKFVKVSPLEYIRTDKGQRIMLCHYPMETWRGSCHGSWHLHGHSHGKLPPKGKRLDVGIDALSYYPISFLGIEEIMKTRSDNIDLVKKEEK